MESQAEMLEMVSQLCLKHAEISEDMNALKYGRDNLDRRFECNLSALNQAISELPPVITILLLEKPPTAKRTLGGALRLLSAMRLVKSGGEWQSSTPLNTVQAAMSDISRVESNMRTSQEEAGAKKLETANLASKAARHIEQCTSVHSQVSNAQTKTQTSLDATKRDIDMAQQQIAENLSLILEVKHQNRAAKYRKRASCVDTGMQERSAEKLKKETALRGLDEVLTKLKVLGAEVEETARKAVHLRDEARVLTDRYCMITTSIRDVLRALLPLHHLHHDIWQRKYQSCPG
ncbi:hypothetical protein N658DRAFT_540803 [Parathielavia hyrcaniae]|uniref:Uncharacterized protein n=1 Tax=Parathielavia hyrcaniae TaxID=113614 RepID=A0AAN6PW54_9PEZI|nr:hypothetical protein N658DRAFT_540803 [Parathielavia hyrcaniae]